MPWTDAELAEMAAADAEIEADEAGTYAFVSALAGMDADLDNAGTVIDPDIRRARDYQRRYRETNREAKKNAPTAATVETDAKENLLTSL